jgi:uncharacterized SAM-binding protein YcdF (DUF218 family)
MIFFLLLCAVFAGQILIVENPPKNADAIVVIGGDHKPDRANRVAELFGQHYAALVIVSAGTMVREGDDWVHESEVLHRELLQLGVPESAIVVEQRSNSTLENAQYTRHLLDTLDADSILLVTSAYHSGRAHQIFHDVLGDQVTISVQPGTGPGFSARTWWSKADQCPVVISEYWKWLVYLSVGR